VTALSDAEGTTLLEAAAAAPDRSSRRDVLGARGEAFLAWAQHHPRLSVVVADAWAELQGACAKPGEVALAILEAVLAERELL
jgi:hypothetical protein